MANKLPPFTILSIEVTDLLEDLGEDVVFFHVELELDGTGYYTSVPMTELVPYLQENYAPQGDYLNKIRNDMKGFGPKETLVYNQAIDEDFDFEPWIYHFIEDVRPVEHLTKNTDAPLTPEQQQQHEAVVKKLDKLTQLGDGIKSFRLRETLFSDALMDYLTDSVSKTYPEIFNSDPDYIRELQGILISRVMDLSSDVNDLAARAADGE